ncbi:Hypothetical protein A7982_05356 [Minicystis rosea]|nr:Hypothetical protein A7982_05356 [Minicystis rosea]
MVERLVVAHVAGYPIAFVWAVAAIPLAIHLSIGTIDQLGGDMDRVGRFIVGRLAWPAGIAFALAHLTALPWILARDPKRGMRISLISLAVLAALGVLAGAASWAWLMLR